METLRVGGSSGAGLRRVRCGADMLRHLGNGAIGGLGEPWNFPNACSSRLCLESWDSRQAQGSRNSVWVTWRQHPTVSLPLRKTIPDMI